MIFKNNLLKKTPIFLGHVFFLVYALMSLYFYQERTMLFDSGVFSFQILQSESFFFPLDRYGCAITQLIPIFLLKTTSCSLMSFLMIYSLSLVLFYYGVFLIIAYFLKNNRLILIYLLSLCLTYRNTFYFSVSEFSQGLALSILIYGIIEQMLSEPNRNKQIVLFVSSIVLIFVSYYFHPLTFIAIVFIIMVIILKNKYYFNYRLISLLIFTLFWFGINIFLKSNAQGYEAERMHVFKEFFSSNLSLISLPSLQYLMRFIQGTSIISFLIILIIGIISSKRNLLLGLFFILYPLGYFFFNLVIYHKGEAPNMYEQYYIYFGFFAAFVFIETKLFSNIRIESIVVISLLIISLTSIYNAHEPLKNKLNYISTLVTQGRKHEYKKYIITQQDFVYSIAWSFWSFSIETLLYSSLYEPDDAVTYYVPKELSEIQPTRIHDKFYCDLSIKKDMKISYLNKRFFNLPFNTNYFTLYTPHNEQYYLWKIKEDKEWMNLIEEKAKNGSKSIEEVIKLDAIWIADEEAIKELARKKIELQIMADSVWLNTIKQKAKDNNIPITEMVRIDAEYVLKTNQ